MRSLHLIRKDPEGLAPQLESEPMNTISRLRAEGDRFHAEARVAQEQVNKLLSQIRDLENKALLSWAKAEVLEMANVPEPEPAPLPPAPTEAMLNAGVAVLCSAHESPTPRALAEEIYRAMAKVA